MGDPEKHRRHAGLSGPFDDDDDDDKSDKVKKKNKLIFMMH